MDAEEGEIQPQTIFQISRDSFEPSSEDHEYKHTISPEYIPSKNKGLKNNNHLVNSYNNFE